MQIASGTIVGGKVVVDGLSLPEGTTVTVLARGDEVAVRLPPQQEAQLLMRLMKLIARKVFPPRICLPGLDDLADLGSRCTNQAPLAGEFRRWAATRTMSEFWFKSSLFQVEPGEDEETNPYRFGNCHLQCAQLRFDSAG
jgi:hypothetical protein